MEILGRLTAAVAQQFSSLLKVSKGRSRAGRLANRLLEFGQRQPTTPADLALNELISGLEDLLQCALGSEIALQTVLSPTASHVKTDPGDIELLLMHLAISAQEAGCAGRFSIKTEAKGSEGREYATVTVTPPAGSHSRAISLPAVDEIIRQASGEIRVSSDQNSLKIYLPCPGKPLILKP